MLRAGSLEIDRWSRQVRVGGQPITLTPTDLRLLEALARHPGRTFTRDELVARAFGPDYDGLDRTIDTHITNLRRKLDRDAAVRSGASSRNRTRERDARENGSSPQRCVIVTVHGIGYKLATEEDGL